MGIVDVLNSINFEHESYPTYGDFAALPVFAIFFPTVRFFLDRLVFEVIVDFVLHLLISSISFAISSVVITN